MDAAIIEHHLGGQLVEVERQIAEASYIVVTGLCASACAWAMAARPYGSWCVGPRARLLFHVARHPDGSVAHLATGYLIGSAEPGIRAWLEARGVGEAPLIAWGDDLRRLAAPCRTLTHRP